MRGKTNDLKKRNKKTLADSADLNVDVMPFSLKNDSKIISQGPETLVSSANLGSQYFFNVV